MWCDRNFILEKISLGMEFRIDYWSKVKSSEEV